MNSDFAWKPNYLWEQSNQANVGSNAINCLCVCQQIAQLASVKESVRHLANSQQNILRDLVKLHELMTERIPSEGITEPKPDRNAVHTVERCKGTRFSDVLLLNLENEEENTEASAGTHNSKLQTEGRQSVLSKSLSQCRHRSTQTNLIDAHRTSTCRLPSILTPKADFSANPIELDINSDTPLVEITSRLTQTEGSSRMSIGQKSAVRVVITNGEVVIKLKTSPAQENQTRNVNSTKKSRESNYEFDKKLLPRFLDFRGRVEGTETRNKQEGNYVEERALNFYIWIVEDFASVHEAHSGIWSEAFYLGYPGYRMRSKLEFTRQFMGIFIQLVCGQFDDSLKWPFREDIQFTLVDQTARGRNLARTLKPYPDDADEHGIWERPWVDQTHLSEKTAWGVPDFVPLSMLFSDSGTATDYVRNDKIYIAIRLL